MILRGAPARADAIDGSLLPSIGEWVEVPVMRLTPRDLAALIDRLQVLFYRPSRISEDRDLSVGSGIPIDALNQLVELTRGRAAPLSSPLPRTRRLDD